MSDDSKFYEKAIRELKEERDFYKTLLTNVYKAADYLGGKAEMRSNQLDREKDYRAKDRGLADAYANIHQMIICWDSIGQVDYYAANKVVKDLPNILK